jgi:hypothetical protein
MSTRLAARANATEYGLSSRIWTRDISTALKLAKRLKAGGVMINGGAGVDPAMPLGGYKQSGWGRENGRAGVRPTPNQERDGLALTLSRRAITRSPRFQETEDFTCIAISIIHSPRNSSSPSPSG